MSYADSIHSHMIVVLYKLVLYVFDLLEQLQHIAFNVTVPLGVNALAFIAVLKLSIKLVERTYRLNN